MDDGDVATIVSRHGRTDFFDGSLNLLFYITDLKKTHEPNTRFFVIETFQRCL